MKQPQRVAENEIDYRERVRFPFRREAGLARFQIPIAKLAPEKAIKRLGRFAEIVFLERLRDGADRSIEVEQDPLVVTREERGIDFALGFAALHLPEPAGVPEL